MVLVARVSHSLSACVAHGLLSPLSPPVLAAVVLVPLDVASAAEIECALSSFL